MSSDDRTEPGSGSRRLILNPESGTADHVERVRELAVGWGYEVRETHAAEHAIALGRAAAADGVDLLAVAGGDGTLNEVIRGLEREDGLGDVTVGVLPTGTENIFATAIGVEDAASGIELLESGERRTIDVGIAGEEPFVMSCIAGLPADASVATSGELKERFGSLAFVIVGIQEVMSFDGLHMEVTSVSRGEETRWEGEALCAFVGNVRRFAKEGGQANVEDGLFEVVLIEQMPTSDLVAEATAQRLLGQDTEHVHHMQASQVEISTKNGEAIDFSLDGELVSHDRLVLHTRPRALTVAVGPGYDPDPGDAAGSE